MQLLHHHGVEEELFQTDDRALDAEEDAGMRERKQADE